MQTRLSSRVWEREEAFSLIELLTAVSIMVVIIFSLYAMFNQTQKALRANITQVDVLEGGRATAEMLGREIEQLTACNQFETINFYATVDAVPTGQIDTVLLDSQHKTQLLRTNLLSEIYFLGRQTNRWVATGYRVLDPLTGQTPTNGLGTLYRFTTSTNYYTLNYTNLWWKFARAQTWNPQTQQVTNFNRVVDGVVHLRVRAYDPDGRLMWPYSTNRYGTYRVLAQDANGTRMGVYSSAAGLADANVVLRQQFAYDPVLNTQLTFMSNALPAYVELELGVLEPVALKQYQALGAKAAADFLTRQAAKVHLFRQRIPIRTVLQ